MTAQRKGESREDFLARDRERARKYYADHLEERRKVYRERSRRLHGSTLGDAPARIPMTPEERKVRELELREAARVRRWAARGVTPAPPKGQRPRLTDEERCKRSREKSRRYRAAHLEERRAYHREWARRKRGSVPRAAAAPPEDRAARDRERQRLRYWTGPFTVAPPELVEVGRTMIILRDAIREAGGAPTGRPPRTR